MRHVGHIQEYFVRDRLDLDQLPVFRIWRETEVILSLFRCFVSLFRGFVMSEVVRYEIEYLYNPNSKWVY